MPDVKIFWDPDGMTVDSLGSKEYLRATDGDTPYVSVSIRMLSIDAPETHYPGRTKPSRHDNSLVQLARWIQEGIAPVGAELGNYLYPRLASGVAGTLQEHQGEKAASVFRQMVDKMLTKPNGRKRNLFMRTADEPFDQYGRILAYIAPSYSSQELAEMSPWQRATFNLLMVRSGWASPFIIYPSIPKYRDLVMYREAAKEAYLAGRGIWADSLMLSAYEFRMCIKLYNVTKKIAEGESVSSREKNGWVSRYCVDLTTQRIFFPEQYYRVAPYNRLFLWPKDVSDAVATLNLIPAE